MRERRVFEITQLEKFVAHHGIAPPPSALHPLRGGRGNPAPIPGEPADLFQLRLAAKRGKWENMLVAQLGDVATGQRVSLMFRESRRLQGVPKIRAGAWATFGVRICVQLAL